jgi:Flp pilus assembly protein TadD
MFATAQTPRHRQQKINVQPSKEGRTMKNDARALRMIARLAHDRGDVEEATRLFRRLLTLHPVSEEATDAYIYLTRGDRRSAQRAPLEQLDESW